MENLNIVELRAQLVDKLKSEELFLENISEEDLKKAECKTAVYKGMDTNTFWLATQEGIVLYTEQKTILDDTDLSRISDKTLIQECIKKTKSTLSILESTLITIKRKPITLEERTALEELLKKDN